MLHKPLRSVLLFSAILITFVLIFPKPAYSSPAMATVDARPTAHYISTIGVSTPADAYDASLATSADFRYDDTSGAGYFEVRTFTTPSSSPIAWVDLKMNYMADGGGSGEQYRIVYYVDTSGPVVLVPWTNGAHAVGTDIWYSQSEPNDGAWDWIDISDIRIRVETGPANGRAADFEEYEAWVTVTTYTAGTMAVDPASQTNPSSPFTINVNVSNVDDLYSWEFKLYYNSSILTNGAVTEGAFLSGAGSTYFNPLNNTDTYNATHGRYWVTCTLLGDISGVSGSGVLATITFTVDGTAGTTPLDLKDTKLIGYDQTNTRLTYMTHSATDGSVTITALPEFPLGAALEIALVGVIVYIWWMRKRKQPQKLSSKALPK